MGKTVALQSPQPYVENRTTDLQSGWQTAPCSEVCMKDRLVPDQSHLPYTIVGH